MSLRVRGGRSFPTDINLRDLKTVDESFDKALSAIMLAKAASEGTFEDLSTLWAGVHSNATIAKPIEELTATIQSLLNAMTTPAQEQEEE